MTVRRDAFGVPTVRGGSLAEVAYLQGWACAEDRAWQLDLERRRGEGRTAELLGANGVEWDVFARRAELAETARRAFDALSAETREFVTSYVDGVNDAFDAGVEAPELDQLGAAPGRWQPWTPVAVFWVQHVLFGAFPGKLWRHHVRRVTGEGPLDLLRHEGLLGGSNAFAIGGGLTASGLPLIAGDPHRLLEDPNVYVQVRLTCDGPDDGFDVVGFAFAGVPGIQHFGHARDVAWAITNAIADAHDIRPESAETLSDAHRTVEAIPVRDRDPVVIVRRRTDHGPVVIDGPGEALSLRTPPDVLASLGFEAFPRLLRAQSVGDVEAAFAHWVEPVNNVVAADRTGRVVHFVAGRVPVRTDDGWSGWVSELPHREVASEEVAVTANQRASNAYEAIGDDFAPPFRADRITELLGGEVRHTPRTAATVLLDTVQTAGVALLDLVASAAGLSSGAAALQRRLATWDRRMAADSQDAALFGELRDEVVARLCAAPELAPLADAAPYGELFAPWFALPGRVAIALHTVLAVPEPFGLSREAVVRDALVAIAERRDAAGAAGAVVEVSWGERHLFGALHGRAQLGLAAPDVPATRLSGDSDCVMMSSSVPGTPLALRASVARYVWCLADRAESAWVVPLGASGVPTSPHHRDQHHHWATGNLVPVPSTPPTEERQDA